MSYRIQLVMLSFLLLLWNGCYSVQLATWGVFHPSPFFEKFYLQSGVFSPAASLSITLLHWAAGCISFHLGFRLAMQKPVAYRLGARAAPFLFVADVLNLSLLNPTFETRRGLAIAIACFLVAAFYLWYYRFCINPRNQELLNKRG